MGALLNELKEKKPIEFLAEKIYKEPDLIPTSILTRLYRFWNPQIILLNWGPY